MALAFAKIRAANGSDLVEEYFAHLATANHHRKIEYHACCRIQRAWRRYTARAWLRFLHTTAVMIQKHWRGRLAKERVDNMIDRRRRERRMEFYNKMANRIQRIWRGYYSRKVIFDYHRRKAYIESVRRKTAEMRRTLATYQARQRENQDRLKQQMIAEKVDQLAGKLHHLLSTAHIPGVLASGQNHSKLAAGGIKKDGSRQKESPVKDGPAELSRPGIAAEKMDSTPSSSTASPPGLLAYLSLTEDSLRHAGELDRYLQDAIGKNPRHITVKRRDDVEDVGLAPTEFEKTAQGPFLPRYKLMRTIKKPFKPSLRVETDFYDTERAVRTAVHHERALRISDEYFHAAALPPPTTYLPSLRRKAPFGTVAYGTKSFRETDPSFNISSKDFRTIIPPVPLFDDLLQN